MATHPVPGVETPKQVARRWASMPISDFRRIVAELEQRLWLPLWGTEWERDGWMRGYSVLIELAQGFYIQSIHDEYEGPPTHSLDVWVDNGEGRSVKLLHAHLPGAHPDPAIRGQRPGMRRESADWMEQLVSALDQLVVLRGGVDAAPHPRGGARAVPMLTRLPDLPPALAPGAASRAGMVPQEPSMPVPYHGGPTSADALNALFDATRALAITAADALDGARIALHAAWHAACPTVYIPPTSATDAAQRLALEWGAAGAAVERAVEDVPVGTTRRLQETGQTAYGRWLVAEAVQRERVDLLARCCAALPGGHDRHQERRPDGTRSPQCRRCGMTLPPDGTPPPPISPVPPAEDARPITSWIR